MHTILQYLVFFLVFYSSTSIRAQSGQIIVDSMYSTIIGEYSHYSIYLPGDIHSSNSTNSVIYMLHGFNGDNQSWINHGHAPALFDSLLERDEISRSVLVMPDGNNSYFINNYNNQYRFEDFFIEEFIPYIEALYSIELNRNRRSILGYSMGGFGAIVLSLKHTDLFSTCLAISAAARPPDIFAQLPQSRYKQLFGEVFCDTLSGMERITQHWKANSPYFIIDSLYLKNELPLNIYIDCGNKDYLSKSNLAFHNLLLENNIPHEYIEREGEHNWTYWRAGFINSLIYLESKKQKNF